MPAELRGRRDAETHGGSPPRFWAVWLVLASLGVAVFGLVLVLAPALARRGFSLLVYLDPQRVDGFGPEAVRYVELSHAVIGGVMIGWGVALAALSARLVSRGSRFDWNLVAGSLLAWFVPDTLFSIWSGFWQNAVLNLTFATLFALPLAALRGATTKDD